MQVVCPCKECENREIKCHVQCGKYKAYKIELETQKALKEKARQELSNGSRTYVHGMPALMFYSRWLNKRR